MHCPLSPRGRRGLGENSVGQFRLVRLDARRGSGVHPGLPKLSVLLRSVSLLEGRKQHNPCAGWLLPAVGVLRCSWLLFVSEG